MKMGFYPKLAWDGIRKNKRLYLPYILTCVGMVMMCYIVFFLTVSPVMDALPGGYAIRSMLDLGGQVLVFFAALFLFYTNSFLMRRRKKEFGLYNILGMGKWSIGKILFWESVLIAAIALISGIFAGVLLSKLFELGLVNLASGSVSYDFSISTAGMGRTAMIFGVIFALLFLNGLRQVSLSNPIALLRSENAGEKPPKANWLLGLAGLGILGAAYYLAVTIEDPLTAILVFFVAVAMVIAATYLLFITGSVALCRLLQKNEAYYYKPNHFVSISSMAYRMKRNGAGLASICILLTMVLVMLSSTAALYVGKEASLKSRYHREITLDVSLANTDQTTPDTLSPFREKAGKIANQGGAELANVYDYRSVAISGAFENGVFSDFSNEQFVNANPTNLFLIPIEDYNQVMGQSVTLEENEVLVFPFRTDYSYGTFQISGGPEYTVKGIAGDWIGHGDGIVSITPTLYVFVPELRSAAEALDPDKIAIRWSYGFDLNVESPQQISIYRALKAVDWTAENPNGGFFKINVDSRAANRADFYGLYGGLFYLGIILSIVFLAAAVLIIYYKQISEGYEDQGRFGIMQKVGMTQKDIRKSINSQMLTVFFLPLVTAGLHLCFAFPLVRKLLLLFNLTNTGILIATTAVCFLLFGVFYALVYKLTSNAYFSIVSGAKED